MGINKQISFTSEGMQFLARTIMPSDREMLQNGFRQLSVRTKFLRFSSIDAQLSEFQLKYLTEVDGVNHVAWGVLDISGDESIPVAVGRFVRLKESPDTAEVGITVLDAYQKKGLGKMLFILLNILAAEKGVLKLRYHVLSENRTVLGYLKHFEILKQINEGPLTFLETKVIRNHRDLSNVPEMQDFITSMKTVEQGLGID